MKTITIDGLTINVDGEIESLIVKDGVVSIKVKEKTVYVDRYNTTPFTYPLTYQPAPAPDPYYPSIWGSDTTTYTMPTTTRTQLPTTNTPTNIYIGSVKELIQE